MKKSVIFVFCLFLSLEVLYANGDFYIAKISDENNNVPLEICCDDEFHDYYPSRIFDIDHSEETFTIYNLYVVYIDSCSSPQLKTVQVEIPKEFKGIRCRVGAEELVYSFQTKESEILVSIPATEKDTLSEYDYSMKYTNPYIDSTLYSLVKRMPDGLSFRKNRYLGIKQYKSFTLYYYNFNRKQKDKFVLLNKEVYICTK